MVPDFELGTDRIDVSALTDSDGEPIDFNSIYATPVGGSPDLRINDDSWNSDGTVALVSVPRYVPGAPMGELAYAMGPEDFLFG